MAQQRNDRAPLIVVTLSIPPDIQTLAPKVIKRGPRKQPSFCQNFKMPATIMVANGCSAITTAPSELTSGPSSSLAMGSSEKDHSHHSTTSPEFCIKGYEILDKSPSTTMTQVRLPTLNYCENPYEHETENNVDDDDGQIDTCCSCVLDGGRVNDNFTLLAKTELLMNFDGYEMDTFGHLPGDSRTPTPSPIRRFVEGTPRCRLRRTCSPGTGQVIRVTMNNKNIKRR